MNYHNIITPLINKISETNILYPKGHFEITKLMSAYRGILKQ